MNRRTAALLAVVAFLAGALAGLLLADALRPGIVVELRRSGGNVEVWRDGRLTWGAVPGDVEYGVLLDLLEEVPDPPAPAPPTG